jgi:collagen type III alpha
MQKPTSWAIAPLIMLWSSSALAGGWTISESTGQVSVTRAGLSKVAVRGGALSAGDVVATGPKSRVVLVRGEEYLVVSPGSRLKIAAPESDGLVTQIIEEAGTVLFKIKKKMTPHFGVQTPYLAAVVKGTTFSVTVTDKGASVQVTEGAVEVSTLDGGASDLVKPGIIAYVGAGDQQRLTVEGDTVKTLDSPNRVAPQEPVKTTAVVTESEAQPAVLASAITEDAKPLSEVTGGLIEGNAGVSTLQAQVAPAETKEQVAVAVAVQPSAPVAAVQPAPVEAQPVSQPAEMAPTATDSVPPVPVQVTAEVEPVSLPPVPVEPNPVVTVGNVTSDGNVITVTTTPLQPVAGNVVIEPVLVANTTPPVAVDAPPADGLVGAPVEAPPVLVADVDQSNNSGNGNNAGGNGNGNANGLNANVINTPVVDTPVIIVADAGNGNGNGNGNGANARGADTPRVDTPPVIIVADAGIHDNIGNGNAGGNGNGNGPSENVNNAPIAETPVIIVANAGINDNVGNDNGNGGGNGSNAGGNGNGNGNGNANGLNANIANGGPSGNN